MIKLAESVTSKTAQQNIKKAIEHVLPEISHMAQHGKAKNRLPYEWRFPNASKVFTPETLRQALTDILEHLTSKDIYQANDYHALALYDTVQTQITREEKIEDLFWDTDFLEPPGTFTRLHLYAQYRMGITEDTIAIDLPIPYQHEKMRLQPAGQPLKGINDEVDKNIAITLFRDDETPLKTLSFAEFYDWLYNVSDNGTPMPEETWGKEVPISILTRRQNGKHRIEFTAVAVKKDGTVDGQGIAHLGMLKHQYPLGAGQGDTAGAQTKEKHCISWHPTKTTALIAAYTALPDIKIKDELVAAAKAASEPKSQQQVDIHPLGIDPEYIAAELQSLERENTPSGFYLAAQAYHRGIGTERDMTKAIRLYRMAGELGHIYALHNLAVAYTIGDGVPKDAQKALQYRKKAAEAGSLADMTDLASQYLTGKDVKEDKEEALRLYNEAVAKGYPQAQHNLAFLYASGDKVPRDPHKAFKLYSQAAEKGYPKAITNLAQCYFAGIGVKTDIEKAIELYKKASSMGDYVADFSLGIIYITPQLSRYNPEIAYDYLIKAHIANVKKETVHFIEATKEKMQPDTCVAIHLKSVQAAAIKSLRLSQFASRAADTLSAEGIEFDPQSMPPAEKQGVILYYNQETRLGRLQDITDGSIWDINMTSQKATKPIAITPGTITTYDIEEEHGNNERYAVISTKEGEISDN